MGKSTSRQVRGRFGSLKSTVGRRVALPRLGGKLASSSDFSTLGFFGFAVVTGAGPPLERLKTSSMPANSGWVEGLGISYSITLKSFEAIRTQNLPSFSKRQVMEN